MAEPARSGLGRRLYLAYGLGAAGTSMFSVVPGLLLLYFMTDTLGIAPALAGAAMFAGKLWDVVTDPVMGSLSDHTRSSWGRRRPWLLLGALTLPVCFALLFSVPPLETPFARWLWVLAAFLLAATAFTIYQVPYVAMPAEMTDDSHEQTVIMSWRMACMVLGILAAGALAPLLVRLGGGGRPGYALMGAVMGGLCFVALVTAFIGTRRAPFLLLTRRPEPLRRQLAGAWRNRAFRTLVTALFMQLTGVSALLATVPYFARYVLHGSEATVTALFVALVAPAIAGMPLWVAVGRRVGKRRGWAMAVAVYAVSGLLFAVASPARLGLLFAGVALMGIAYGGTQVFPFALLPDVVQRELAATGERREGVMSGLFTCAEKCGNALGALLAGLVLQASGFVEGAPADQPESAVAGIRVAASVLPAALLLASLAPLRRWPPTEAA